MDVFIQGFFHAFTPTNMLWIFVGTFLGMLGGTLPGISGVTMMAVVLPIMYKMPVDAMTLAVVGIMAAAIYSGGTAGILYNIPGDAGGIPTTIEGYRLTLKGRSLDALTAACSASLFGNTFGTLCMFITLPLFVYIVTFFGTAERSLLGMWALMIISVGVLTREDTLKGLISIGLGLSMCAAGTQATVGTVRFVQSIPMLWDGFHILWIVLGCYAIPQLLRVPQMKDILQKMRSMTGDRNIESPRKFYGKCFSDMKEHLSIMVKGSILGTIIGIIPGIGSLTAGWLAYSASKKFAKQPELVGKGSVEAIVSIESANNAAWPGALIPMFSLGIPGSGNAAIIMSAFVMAGLNPGPQMMQQSGELVWTIVFGILICGLAFSVAAYPFRLMAGSLIKLPEYWLVAFIGPLVMVGSYLAKFSLFGGNITFVIAVIAMIAAYLEVPIVGILLGNVLGRVIEVDLVRAYQVGGFSRFAQPFSVILIIVVILTLAIGVYQNYFSKKKDDKSGQLKMVGQGDNDEFTEADDGSMRLVKQEFAEGKTAFLRLVSGVIGLLLSFYVSYASRGYPVLAKVWPYIVAVVFLLIPSALMILFALPKLKEVKRYLKERPRLSSRQKRDALDSWVLLAVLVLCFNLTPMIGFIEGCGLFSFLICMYMNPKKPMENLLAGATMFVMVFVMKWAFNFILPMGPLGI